MPQDVLYVPEELQFNELGLNARLSRGHYVVKVTHDVAAFYSMFLFFYFFYSVHISCHIFSQHNLLPDRPRSTGKPWLSPVWVTEWRLAVGVL